MNEAQRTNLGRWELIRQGSANRRILIGMLTVGGLHLIVSLAAVGKELLIAHQFGTTDMMDAFLVAFLLPSLLMNTVKGSFEAAFIPEFIRVREREGAFKAGLLFSHILSRYLVFLLVLSLVLFFLFPFVLPWLGSSFDVPKMEQTQSLFLILMPTLVLGALIGAWGSVLKAGEYFVPPSLSPAVTHLAALGFIWLAGAIWGVRALATGLMIGLLLEAVFLMGCLKSRGDIYWPKWHHMDASIKKVLRQYFPMIVGTFLMGSTLFVDQAMAAAIGSGSVSALHYGSKVVLFIAGLSSIALGTSIFPHFSKMVALEDWKSIRHTLKTYARLILLVTVPLTSVLIYFSQGIIQIVFERGAFTSLDTRLVGEIQVFYLLQIPFYLIGIMGVRLLSALSKNQVLMVIGGINLLVNIVGNYICIQYLGVAGIGLSTSIVYLVSMILIYFALKRQLEKRERLSEVRLGQ